MKETDSNQFKNQLIVLSEAANTCQRPCIVVEVGIVKYANRAFKKRYGISRNVPLSTVSVDDVEILNIPSRMYGIFLGG